MTTVGERKTTGEKIMLDQIMEILTPRRMMSVGNLALLLEMEAEELHPKLMLLDSDGRIRYAQSKCSGSCSTCSTTCTPSGNEAEICGEENVPPVDPTAIVISLELRPSEDD